MHGVFITFTTATGADELRRSFERYAKELTAVVGLVSKTWIGDGSLVGGFYVFETATAADDYLTGELFGALRRDRGFSALELRRFDVLDDLSVITNGIPSGDRR
jgi:putative monooxygenase ydhR